MNFNIYNIRYKSESDLILFPRYYKNEKTKGKKHIILTTITKKKRRK